MTILHPYWLALAVPLGVAYWLWPPPKLLQRGLRVGWLVLLLLGLAGLTPRLSSRAGTVIVVADRSASMPGDAEVSQKEIIDLLQREMGSSDNLGVVSFGRDVAVDRAPQAGQFVGFQREVGRDTSNLAEALETAVGLVPRDAPGRILVLSDGRWTGRDPAAVASRAATRDIAIDYRCIERARADDLAVERIDLPASVAPGESFIITGWVLCPSAQEVAYELRERGRLIATGKKPMSAGLNRLTFRDRAAEAGNHSYTLTVTGPANDPIPGNNQARALVGIEGPRPILHVTRAASKQSGLASLLQNGGLKLAVAAPEECRWSLEELTRYSAVLLENIPADQVGHAGMETIATWVQQTGAGLMMTGGRESYGPGGYYKSALDPVLPVSMELRNEHRKLSVAIVVALDRSGSMALPVAGGRTKMDLANLGTIEVLNLLGPQDEFGCIAVDTIPHTIAPLSRVTDKGSTRAKIKKIESMGGGIFVHEALVAASKMIATATAGTKHIILFSDAQDSEEPGDYKTLLEKITRAGITVSVIGLGKKTDVDGPLLEDIARLGKGRCYFSDRAEELPRLFVQDTFVIARNTFLEEKTPVRETPGLAILTGRPLGLATSVGGYNLCYLRKDASLAGITLDEYQAPLVASWQSGTGRVLCFTGEADGKYAGALARWDRAGDFYASLARWVAGQGGPLPDNMLLTQEVRNGVQRITLHLDPERKKESFQGRVTANVITAEPGGTPQTMRAELRWAGPDQLTLDVPRRGGETVVTTVEVPGQKPVMMPPACLPYSPELRPQTGESGRTALDRLARATGGRERDVELQKLWSDLPRKPRLIPIGPWLLLLAVVLILLEVLERRTGLLSRPRRLTLSTREERKAKHAAPKPKPVTAAIPTVEPAAPTSPAPNPLPPEEDGGVLDALRRARERSRSRLD